MARFVREKRRYLWLGHQARAGDGLHHGRPESARERERLVQMMPPVYGFELMSHRKERSSEEDDQWQ
ncbi:uncharacterized protein N7506_008231 [Penicillium brevicompactum]|uniref:uncharacterized protein n=1 Tax=Penicillium brevicompactum TaxID=5074 RepID=UPI00253F8BAB|nr:uncharacterized protein N7506_008231 [Penicillium brevicompactum]KAJ5325129.1 hypothetical protein N7506_008231 [Penicillium brevicompactum]